MLTEKELTPAKTSVAIKDARHPQLRANGAR